MPDWWCISGDDLMEMLRRCHRGEEPGTVYAEFYANSDHEKPAEDDDDEPAHH